MAPEEMKFCTRCGNAIEEEIVRRGYCPFCGGKDAGTRFCPDCGATLHQFGSIVTGEGEYAAAEAEAEVSVGEQASSATAVEAASEGGTAAQNCPDCGNQLYYVQQYNQWYCYTCKGYKQSA
jgi:DNA-directed RNA polymerase subunit M/transcription elongation factor TFIIS